MGCQERQGLCAVTEAREDEEEQGEGVEEVLASFEVTRVVGSIGDGNDSMPRGDG